MSTFRERVVETPEAPPVPGPVQPDPKPVEDFHQQTEDELVEVFETEKGHKIADSYFGLREVAVGDFNVKMTLARIDKFVKGELDSKQYDKTTRNYKGIIAEMEGKIGSAKLNGKARLQRILAYIGLAQKTQRLKELKEKFFSE